MAYELPESEHKDLLCYSYMCKGEKRSFKRIMEVEKRQPPVIPFTMNTVIGGPPGPPSLPFTVFHQTSTGYCVGCGAVQFIGPEPEEVAASIEKEIEEIKESARKRRC